MRRRIGRLRRFPTGDEGIAAIGIIMTVIVGILFLLFLIIIPLLSGTEKAGRTQTAADAAALAGALSARDRAVDEVEDAVQAFPAALSGTSKTWRFQDATAGGSGYGDAAAYAARNNASIDSYHHEASLDRVEVDVRLDQPAPQGGPVLSRAVAQVGVELESCEIVALRSITGYTTPPPPTPTPTPTPAPTPTPTPTPTPPFVPQPIFGPWSFTMSCDGKHGFQLANSDVAQLVDDAVDRLEDLEPRLIG